MSIDAIGTKGTEVVGYCSQKCKNISLQSIVYQDSYMGILFDMGCIFFTQLGGYHLQLHRKGELAR